MTDRREARPATFDSATAMVAAVARFQAGQDFPVLGMAHGDWLRPLLAGLNRLPRSARNWVYRMGSGREGLPPDVVARADAERLAEGITGRYGTGPYDSALIGSTPGAAVHLAAALGAPLLPQTILLPVARHGVGVDDPAADVEACRGVAADLLAANPDLVVHQMFDPCQDRLTLARFAYFRVKRRRLGPAYEQFLRRTLSPGATIVVVDSSRTWPVTTVGDRHYFQFGGIGDISPDEYRRGSERIARFLADQGSAQRGWTPPPADADAPEAEWGLDRALLDDVQRFADAHGYRVVRLTFDDADSLSPLVAELYRWWYRRLGRPDDHLYVESFVLLDPLWVLRAGAVPYWMTFNSDTAANHLERYLGQSGPFRRIDLSLIANGMRSPGLASVERWRSILGQATAEGRFAGTDPRRYPSDLASFARYRDVLRHSRPLYPLPEPLPAGAVAGFFADRGPELAVGVSASD